MKSGYGKVSVLFALGITAAMLAAGTIQAEETATSAVAESAQDSVEEAAGAAAESAAESVEGITDSAQENVEDGTISRPEYRGLDYLTLGEYKGLTVEVAPIEVTEAEIDARITSDIHSSDAGRETLTEGVVETGDIANIDFVGKIDDVPFDGGSDEDYDLEIGSGSFIDGFEDGLIGVEIGSTVDLDLTFPESYGNTDLAGQETVFTVTVNSVTRYKTFDDELAAALSDGEADTTEAYRQRAKAMLEEEKLETRETSVKSQLLSRAAENCTVSEYPQDLVDYNITEITSNYQYAAAMYGVDFNTLLTVMVGITEEDFPAYAEEVAKSSVRQEFCVTAIAETESLLPEGTELEAAYDELAAQVGAENGAELVATYGEYAVNYRLMYDAVTEFLYENATITEVQEDTDSGVEEPAEAESGVAAAEEPAGTESEAAAVEEPKGMEPEAAAAESASEEAAGADS